MILADTVIAAPALVEVIPLVIAEADIRKSTALQTIW